MISEKELQNHYSYFTVREGTDGFNILERFTTYNNGSIAELESNLGIVTRCMDMALYKNKHYYIAFDLIEGCLEEKMHSDLEKIDFQEFFNCVTDGEYKHYGCAGTPYFHEYVLIPSIIKDKKQ